MRRISRQRGMSSIGFIILAIMIGFFILCGFKLWDMYYEFALVKSSINDIADNVGDIKKASKGEITGAISKIIQVNTFNTFSEKDFFVEETASGPIITLDYEVRTELIYNIDVVAKFYHVADFSL